MLCEEVKNYLSAAKGTPFFYVAGDEDYLNVLGELKQANVAVVRMSDFCSKDDKFPSVDELVNSLRAFDADSGRCKCVVIGLGEYLALRGAGEADTRLSGLKEIPLGNARVVFLLRGVPEQARGIIEGDPKMKKQQRGFVCEKPRTDISITNVKGGLGRVEKPGIKYLLRALEDGAHGDVTASTQLLLNNSLFHVTTIDSAYSVIKMRCPDLALARSLGTEEQWRQLLSDLDEHGGDINAVFARHGAADRIGNDLREAVSKPDYPNWLFFVYCKLNADKLTNAYLKFVAGETARFDDFKNDLLVKITEIKHDDPDFRRLYDARKALLKGFTGEDAAVFVKANEIDPDESIYRLTDNTLTERKTIVKWVASHGVSDALPYVYPALAAYLKDYRFTCSELADELTAYFNAYKKQKVTNRVSPEFLKLVEEYAESRIYARLPTRDSAVKSVAGKKSAQLYWIDALGVEYLSYITALAEERGLSIHIDITRAELPTITSVNRRFYDDWTGGKKYKESGLDDIKHKEQGGYHFTEDTNPIHIPAELAVIEKALSTAATELKLGHCTSFVIAGDHGASRLAVIHKREVPYDTDTKGEHSGRCCKAFDGCCVPHMVVTDDRSYIVLSDYGRFRGSRAANVEVHGGATLEEVVVPVITLRLKDQRGVEVKLLNPGDITADRKSGVTLCMYISHVNDPGSVRLELNGASYRGTMTDETHFTFALKDIKRAKKEPYTAEVFDGHDRIGSVTFAVKSKMATMNSDLDIW